MASVLKLQLRLQGPPATENRESVGLLRLRLPEETLPRCQQKLHTGDRGNGVARGSNSAASQA